MSVHSVPILLVEAAVILVGMLRGFRPIESLRALPRRISWLLGVLLAVALYTALFVAPTSNLAIMGTCVWMIHILFGFSVFHLLVTERRNLRPLLWLAVALGVCSFAFVLVLYVAAIDDPADFDWIRFGLAGTNIRHIGAISAVGAAASLGVAAQICRGGRYWLAIAMASIAFAVSFWSGTRGSLVAVSCAFALGFTLLPCLRTMRTVNAIMMSMSAGALLSLLHMPPHPSLGLLRVFFSVSSGAPDALSNGRLALWQGTIRTFWQRPLFGFGESQFRVVVPEALGHYNHPHNIVLQILLQWGSVGAICFFGIGSAILWHAWSAMKRSPNSVAPPLLVGGSLVVYSFYDGTLYYPYPVMMTALAVAAIFAAHVNRKATASSD